MTLRPSLLIAILLAAVACSDDDASDPTSPTGVTASTAISTSAEPTTTPSPATTSSTSSPAPTTTASTTAPTSTSPGSSTSESSVSVPAADDWRAVIQTLGQRRQDLYASPDVSRIGEVCGGETPCFDQLNVQLGDLASKGWRIEGADPYVVLDAQVEQFDGDDIESSLLVTVIAVVQRPVNAGTIVDSSGATVAEVEAETEPGTNSEGRVILARVGPADDQWRIVSQDRLREVPA